MNLKMKLLEDGYSAENLDSIVYDACSEQASNANNGGLDNQITFLNSLGWSDKMIMEALKYNDELGF